MAIEKKRGKNQETSPLRLVKPLIIRKSSANERLLSNCQFFASTAQ